MWELGLILLVALILLGPRQLTETAKVVGKLYREIQKMTSDLRNSVDLDSLTKPTYSRESDPPKADDSAARYKDQEIAPIPGEKSGPDFYAELLESAKDEEEKKEASEEAPKTAETSKESPDEKRDASSDTEGEKKERAQ